LATSPGTQEQKFFGSFFQKRTFCFLSFLHPIALQIVARPIAVRYGMKPKAKFGRKPKGGRLAPAAFVVSAAA